MEKYIVLPRDSYSFQGYTLVALRRQDILKIKAWRNDQIDILRQKNILTDQDQKNYYNKIVFPTYGQNHPGQILFSILQEDACIGYGGLVHISWEDKRGEISFLVDSDRVYDSQTYQNDFQCFLEIIKHISFTDLGLNRLFLETYDMRKKHIQIIEKSGFALEGRLKEHVIINGASIDSLIHGMVKSDYEESKNIY
ncbi:GNAT family N-acetyltransferase [uncultured Desulfobacter sp.]|uniref:GNAT family N-acetyltransferase n=1 Tax=uncultured Desulfobacter sp. TaxID=240139 RepID=UPI002AAA8E71|nr:GNAT family N-acetyltransferase [uncultured Desulfobacter sp.]